MIKRAERERERDTERKEARNCREFLVKVKWSKSEEVDLGRGKGEEIGRNKAVHRHPVEDGGNGNRCC